MAKKTKKAGQSVLKVISVLLGVLGAGWLFSEGWHGVFDYLTGYSKKYDFIDYFFSSNLFPVVTLFVAMLFIIRSLRDLDSLTGVFSIITAVLAVISLVAFCLSFFNGITAEKLFEPEGLIDCGKLVLLVAYFLFAMYTRNGGKIKNVAWAFAIVALIIIFGAAVYGFASKAFASASLVSYIFTVLAHLAIFFCGLRQY